MSIWFLFRATQQQSMLLSTLRFFSIFPILTAETWASLPVAGDLENEFGAGLKTKAESQQREQHLTLISSHIRETYLHQRQTKPLPIFNPQFINQNHTVLRNVQYKGSSYFTVDSCKTMKSTTSPTKKLLIQNDLIWTGWNFLLEVPVQ